MRCPKCGYNSFDHLDSCKKCGKDLLEFKQRYGIKSVLFPGEMRPKTGFEDTGIDVETADAAVTAATVGMAAAASASASESQAAATESDDFGFDFMGESTEEDDLSFDELFEEAPEDEDVEESIEGPQDKSQRTQSKAPDEDFSFDLPDEDSALEDDFGFDPSETMDQSGGDDEFSFDDDEQDAEEDKGTAEGPKNPFDLPESSQLVGAPEETQQLFDRSVRTATSERQPDPRAAELAARPLVEPETQYQFDETASIAAPAGAPATQERTEAAHAATVETDNTPEAAAALHPSFGSRIMAFLYDVTLLAIVGISFVIAAEAAMSTESARLIPTLETLVDLSVPYFLVLFSLAFGYFTLFHFLVGQTPGEMLTGLRVETVEGEPLAFAQAFLRSVGGLLQLLPIGLGCLAILASPERRGWNDRLAGTRVVLLQRISGEE